MCFLEAFAAGFNNVVVTKLASSVFFTFTSAARSPFGEAEGMRPGRHLKRLLVDSG